MINDAIIYPSMTNRSQKRDFKKCATKAFDKLSVINASFVSYVANEIDSLDMYKFVYAKHYDWWIESCKILKQKYPQLTINENWFAQNYNYEI